MLRKLKANTKDLTYSKCALPTGIFLVPHIRTSSLVDSFILFCAFISVSTVSVIGALRYMTSDQKDCECEGNNYFCLPFLTFNNPAFFQ